MALAPKKETKKEVDVTKEFRAQIVELTKRVFLLEERIIELEKEPVVVEAPKAKSINRVETFNNEEAPSVVYDGMRMLEEDKINSMRNAIKILPPNMIVKGRHVQENIEAICGFKIDSDMIDVAYKGIVHDEP